MECKRTGAQHVLTQSFPTAKEFEAGRRSPSGATRARASVRAVCSMQAGDIVVWRAARGIDPQDPRPTGGHQLEAAADLWKQHLDRDVARDTEQHNSNVDQRHAPRKAHRHGYDDIQRPYQTPRPSTPSSPGR